MANCRRCGHDNPAGFRFCGGCGALLVAGPGGQERKLVTVVFCDLVGFTARSDRADPEDVGALLRPYHRRLRAEIERFGGTLDKFIGDGVMAVFGAPVGHEDDPERAVLCALRMLAAIGELNRADPGLRLSVRIGVATGEALVSLDPGGETEGVVGDVVNTASRLEGIAPENGIVVGERTWRATATLFDYTELVPVMVRGKADPVPIWRVTGPRSRTGADTAERPQAPFVGREAELAELRAACDRLLAGHGAQLVTVLGEPGAGKSRLVRELFAELDARPELLQWRQGRCPAYGDGITFWALGEIVKAEAGILESDEPARARQRLAAAVAALFADQAERDWLEARLAPLVGLPSSERAGAEPAEAATAWRLFLAAMAATHPLVLVVEDAHWADPALLEFLERLVEAEPGADLLVLVTARPELRERHPGWGGGPGASTLGLSALSDQDTALLLTALLGRSVLPAGLQAELLERAGGNPLYAEEYVRLLVDRGLLDRGGRPLAAAGLPAPEALRVLIAARLDALGPERKALVQDAAVLGRVFWSGALAALGGLAPGEVELGLADLRARELIRPVAVSSVEHQREYAFWHALVRDVAYAQIPRPGRARRHRLAAEWIESLGGQIRDRAEFVAYHYSQALALARAARAPAGELDELAGPARRFLALAGDRAVNLDLGRARSLYASALELYPEAAPERPALLRKLAEATFQAGAHPEARDAFEAALAAAEAAGDRLETGSTLVTLAEVLWNLGDPVGSRARLADAVAILEREPPGPQLAHAYNELAAHRLDAGDFADAVALATRSFELAERTGATDQVVRARGYLGIARCSAGDAGGVDDLRAALDLALRAGLTYNAGAWYANLGNSQGDFDPAAGLATFTEGIAFARRRGLTELAMWMRGGALERLFELGRWDELLREAPEIAAWYLANGPGSFIFLATDIQTARVLVHRGRVGTARELAARCLAVPDAPYMDRLMIFAVAALVELAAGDSDAAAGLAGQFADAVEGRPRWGRARFLPDLVRVTVAAGRPELAGRLLAGFEPEATPAGPERRAVLTATAVLLAERDPGAAADLFAEVARDWEAAGHTLEHGRALLGLGACLHRAGRGGEAGPPLARARELFASLGCLPLVAEAETWIGRTPASGAVGS
jgi:class 3 adenylate cyclase/tetratricopeptide (TPR) repeat protein